MRPRIVMLFGPPGSGKSTQSRLLADKLGWLVVDTGQLLERIVHDPAKQKSPVVQRERAKFDSGQMMSARFAARHMLAQYRALYAAGHSIVVDGHAIPKQVEIVMPELIKMFGASKIAAYVLTVDHRVSVVRNSKRKVCTFCSRPLLTDYPSLANLPMCPVCGAKLYRRTLDKPAVIRERLTIYERDVSETMKKLRAYKVVVKRVNGEDAPAKVCMRMYHDLKD